MDAMGWVLTGTAVVIVATALVVLPLLRRRASPAGRDAAMTAARKAIRQSRRHGRRRGRGNIRGEGYGGDPSTMGTASTSDSGGMP
ncbi:hypothetical protein OG777_01195 [Micromonospora peucetia]|uniref:Uncharacterized protein n=1 Tax=Micromonospora peucetia TaxID=47871 RepID=A0ABZ1EDL2_9ACTN|nr:hypothetical protein [Micromonospora peucetia]MCX4385543.1 hypothetical protein [Micromonospora peucetia]WSA32933.1 hypothetical protein OIE14_02310 [Micromonospora peucetia]